MAWWRKIKLWPETESWITFSYSESKSFTWTLCVRQCSAPEGVPCLHSNVWCMGFKWIHSLISITWGKHVSMQPEVKDPVFHLDKFSHWNRMACAPSAGNFGYNNMAHENPEKLISSKENPLLLRNVCHCFTKWHDWKHLLLLLSIITLPPAISNIYICISMSLVLIAHIQPQSA